MLGAAIRSCDFPMVHTVILFSNSWALELEKVHTLLLAQFTLAGAGEAAVL